MYQSNSHVPNMQSLNSLYKSTSFRTTFIKLTINQSIHLKEMARLSVVFAAAGVLLLVSMAAIAEASTKTIFTTTFDEENPTNRRTGESCSQQMMEQQMLNHCMMYLMTSRGRGRGQFIGSNRSEAEQHLEQCCMQLRNIEEGCRCDSIKMMMNQQGWSQQEMGQMMGMAMNLPERCNLEPQQCQMRAVWF